MNNLNRRLDRLESALGLKGERFILLISCSDPTAKFPEDSPFKEDEILPGLLCFVYGPPLSAEELDELRAKYAAETPNMSIQEER